MYVLWIILTYWFGIVVHELGHYVAAKSIGMMVSHVEIGSGKLLYRFTMFHDNWRVYMLPNRAFVAMFVSGKQWKNLVSFAAGPFASFSLALVLWWFGLSYLAVIPLYQGALNCIPFKTKHFNSDGYNIRKAWRKRNEKAYPKYMYSTE
jgi:regulator of sigma E protease